MDMHNSTRPQHKHVTSSSSEPAYKQKAGRTTQFPTHGESNTLTCTHMPVHRANKECVHAPLILLVLIHRVDL